MSTVDLFSFTLPQDFLDVYRGIDAPWGFVDVADNSFSELTFLDKYSRVKEDGSKETWVEVCERVINGMYSIQKDHAKSNRLPWNDRKAQASAQEAFDRMFNFKWTPPGRGLWVMGTPLVMTQRNSAALQNCAFVSTKDMTKQDPSKPFAFLMEASMLGIGVGFDTLGAGKNFQIHEPDLAKTETYVIPDTREGWVQSVRLLLESYLISGRGFQDFDYDEVRPAGSPIRTFGGTAAGPGPLIELHDKLRIVLVRRVGKTLTSTDITDIGNLIGVCVVSGNVRRSAELALGQPDDEDFLKLKDATVNPERMHWCDETTPEHDCPGEGWGGMSNNSMSVEVGSNYDPFISNIALNGEPGLVWMDVSRKYGRLVDDANDKDYRAMGYNPCFHPDTLIETVDGPKRIADITDPTLVYTRGHDGKLTTRKASASWVSRKNAKTLRIQLNNGDDLIVTPEHKIMLRGGAWVEAQDLRPGSALETLNRARRGWRYSGVRLASQATEEQVMEHRLIWEAVYGTIPEGYDVDHINRDHHDNRIENLRLKRHDEHARESRFQVPNNHQVHASNGDFAPSGKHGVKDRDGAINPPRATSWINQHTVIAVTEGPVTDVYDLTVDDTHCMIANGVVAHNCAEQTLESFECCTLVETFLPRHEDLEDFQRTLKFAFLYAKTVTLLPTHWPETNAIMQRNRRIGCSVSGVAEFADSKGLSELKTWFNNGYDVIRRYDRTYSEWLCVRESIKLTSVKPSGTVSLLAGCTPGVHWMPGGEYFLRAQRLSVDSPIVPMLRAAGYTVEPDVQDKKRRVVAYFPIHSGLARPESQVTMWEKALMAVAAQRYWADNSVSVTVSFNPDTEADHIGALLHSIEGQLKTISFLPKGNHVYPQQPYTEITKEEYEAYLYKLMPVDFSVLYLPEFAQEALGEQFCSTDACDVRADLAAAAR